MASRPASSLAALLVLAALSACESTADRAMKKSPDYRAGYSDGCASAGSQGADMARESRVRDETAYKGNQAYRTGWGTGFNACRVAQGAGNGPSLPGGGPIPDPNPHPF